MSGRYADVSWLEVVWVPIIFLQLRVYLFWIATLQLFTPLTTASGALDQSVQLPGSSDRRIQCRKPKTLRRIVEENISRFLVGRLSIEQQQHVLGTTLQVYKRWAKRTGLETNVEELGEDARLLWIGPRRIERVVLYFHGGGYSLPLPEFAASFWNYVRRELEHEGMQIGFAILNYSLIPTATFPTQLAQAATALNYCIQSLNIAPSNIQIAGESAGGNLAVALLSHILHPLEISGIPRVTLSCPIRGVYLMSPWFCLDSDQETLEKGGAGVKDVVGVRSYVYFARKALRGTPEMAYPYLVATTTPESWFEGVDQAADRVLVTTGGEECLWVSALKVAERIRKCHGKGEEQVESILQEGGVHGDPCVAVQAGETKDTCELTSYIIEWVKKGFTTNDDESTLKNTA